MGRVLFFTIVVLATVPLDGAKVKFKTFVRSQLADISKQLAGIVPGGKGSVCDALDPVHLGNGYYMVFRIQANNGQSAYDTFTTAGKHDDYDAFVKSTVPCGCRTTDGSQPCDRHFRSKLLDMWDQLLIDRVRVQVYKSNKPVKSWIFTVDDSDTYISWFKQDNLYEDNYDDLSQVKPYGIEYFSIKGNEKRERRFYIQNEDDDDCHRSNGWLLVSEKAKAPFICPDWEGDDHEIPKIFYSEHDNMAQWKSKQDVAEADLLVISIKLKTQDSAGTLGECRT